MALYGQYARGLKQIMPAKSAKQRVLNHLKNDAVHVIGGENSLGFPAAPLKALIDLRTMKLLMIEYYGKDGSEIHPIDEMIEHCKSLP